MYAAIGCVGECTREIFVFLVIDNLNVSIVDHNLIPQFLTNEAVINESTKPTFQVECSLIDF